MANWVYCNLEISGNKEDLNAITGKIVGNDILNSLLPTPQELVDTAASNNFEDALTDQEKVNVAKYGAKDWFVWNCIHWVRIPMKSATYTD
jgi:hypothetical protein